MIIVHIVVRINWVSLGEGLMYRKCSIIPLSHLKDLEAVLEPHCGTQFVSHDQSPRRREGRPEAVIAISALRIGFAIARRLAQDGAHVVVSSRKQQNVDQALAALQGEGLSVSGTVCHVGKAEDRDWLVATALRHSGNVDFLVCVAGVNPYVGSTLGSSEEVWDKVRSGDTR
ncbi:PREDICTED: dehydrogenase/reductase SDR family member 2, mitochondrial-like [Myotis brandtii]|uniref:dehydrogenase/reductase SDR family member 2, mitochondrial-like n=1 Tax=Myotis brandtii TaxID=109478 RepID=UPI000703FB27|nr:PREDICTED: dehydrogenase/reductase SDR family member 2, mitochondrial-like [Myotis brandtii]